MGIAARGEAHQRPLEPRLESWIGAQIVEPQVDGEENRLCAAREHTVNIRASFALNVFAPNDSGDAFFGFGRFATSLSSTDEANVNFKLPHHSTMTVCGDVKRFNF